VHIVLSGDSIVNQRLTVYTDPHHRTLRDHPALGRCFYQLETLVHNYAYPAAAESGGAYMSSPSFVPAS